MYSDLFHVLSYRLGSLRDDGRVCVRGPRAPAHPPPLAGLLDLLGRPVPERRPDTGGTAPIFRSVNTLNRPLSVYTSPSAVENTSGWSSPSVRAASRISAGRPARFAWPVSPTAHKAIPVPPTVGDVLGLKSQQMFVVSLGAPAWTFLDWSSTEDTRRSSPAPLCDSTHLCSAYPTHWHGAPPPRFRTSSTARAASMPCANLTRRHSRHKDFNSHVNTCRRFGTVANLPPSHQDIRNL